MLATTGDACVPLSEIRSPVAHTTAEVRQHAPAGELTLLDADKAELGGDLGPKRVRSEPRMRRLSVQFDPASIKLDSEAGG